MNASLADDLARLSAALAAAGDLAKQLNQLPLPTVAHAHLSVSISSIAQAARQLQMATRAVVAADEAACVAKEEKIDP